MYRIMSLIEGIGDEVTNFFLIVSATIIIYFAWRSTNVRYDRLTIPQILIIENNRRHILNIVTQRPDAINILRNIVQQQQQSPGTDNVPSAGNRGTSNDTESEEIELDEEDTERNIPLNNRSEEEDRPQNDQSLRYQSIETILNDYEEYSYPSMAATTSSTGRTDEQQQIIEEMDRVVVDESVVDPIESSTSLRNRRSNVVTTSIDSSEPINRSIQEKITRNDDLLSIDSTNDKNIIMDFRIKLKYLNDDLKLVHGNPNEAIGDFKKRNFSVEMSAQKLVRLVFNGHVLQPDTKTLKACGLFDNCVVHCLIHNQRPGSLQQQQHQQQGTGIDNSIRTDGIAAANGDQQQSFGNQFGQQLIYLSIFLIFMVLIFSWYFRLQYVHLFTWYSTAGLFILTTLFLIIIPVLILIERVSA